MNQDLFDFSQEKVCGEVVLSSTENLEIAFWPEFLVFRPGDFLLIQSIDKNRVGVAMILALENFSVNPSRVIIPLQKSREDLAKHYPQLSAFLYLKAKVFVLGSFFQNDSEVVLDTMQYQYFPLHSFTKSLEIQHLMKILKFKKILTLVANACFEVDMKINLLKIFIKKAANIQSFSEEDWENIFIVMFQAVNGNLQALANFFEEIEGC